MVEGRRRRCPAAIDDQPRSDRRADRSLVRVQLTGAKLVKVHVRVPVGPQNRTQDPDEHVADPERWARNLAQLQARRRGRLHRSHQVHVQTVRPAEVCAGGPRRRPWPVRSQRRRTPGRSEEARWLADRAGTTSSWWAGAWRAASCDAPHAERAVGRRPRPAPVPFGHAVDTLVPGRGNRLPGPPRRPRRALCWRFRAPWLERLEGRFEHVSASAEWPTLAGDRGPALCVRRPLLDAALVDGTAALEAGVGDAHGDQGHQTVEADGRVVGVGRERVSVDQ